MSSTILANCDLFDKGEIFRALFVNLKSGVAYFQRVIVDDEKRDFVYLMVNDAFVKHTGLHDVVGKRFSEVVPRVNPSDYEVVGRYNNVLLTGVPETFEINFESLNRWFQIAAYSPKPEHVIAVLDDITDKKRAEEKLKQSEERFRTLFSNMSDGFVLCEAVLDGEGRMTDYRYIEANEAFLVQTGLKKPVIGRRASEVLNRINQEWLEWFNRVVATGEPIRFTDYRDDNRRWYDFYCFSPVPGRFAVLARDITKKMQIESALLESEVRFRELADAMPQLVWTANSDGSVDYYNMRRKEYAGLRLHEEGRYEWAPVLHPDDAEATICAWHDAVETGGIYQAEHRVQCADGSYRWHISRGVAARDESGRIIKWYGTATDIHELKLIQEAVQRSEERMRLAQQVTRSGAFEWNIRTGSLDGSPELHALYGRHLNENNSPYDAWMEHIHPDHRERVLQEIHDAVISGRLEAEWCVIWPDGSKHWIAARGKVFKDAEGQPCKMVGINMDITEVKLAQEALQKSKEFAERIMTSSLNGIYIYNLDESAFSFVNPQYSALTGYTRQDIRAFTAEAFIDLFHPDDWAKITSHIEEMRTAPDGEVYEFEYRFRRKDGQWRWLLSRETVFSRHDNGNTSEYIGTFIDITDRKQAELDLEASRMRPTRFLL